MAEKKEKRYVSDNAQLMAEWDWSRNIGLSPFSLTAGSEKKVWWKCDLGHEWQAKIYSRTEGRGCPKCNTRTKSTIAQNGSFYDWCLRNEQMELLEEWIDGRNPFSPHDVSFGSSRKIWWRCSCCCNEWTTALYNRTTSRQGCPKCHSSTSFPEQAVLFYILKYFPDCISRCSFQGYEFDVYIPSKNIAIEYDGVQFHAAREWKDIEKNTFCKANGILLIRIRETGLNHYDNCICIERMGRGDDSLSCAITQLLSVLQVDDYDVDVKRDAHTILEQYKNSLVKQSVAVTHPALVKQWDYEKNGELKPENFQAGSIRKIWWKCEKGHSWQATIGSRASGRNCPYCGNKQLYSGFNDLKTYCESHGLHVILDEWDYDLNPITPTEVTAHNARKVWWRCNKCDVRWEAVVDSRTKGHGCPACGIRYKRVRNVETREEFQSIKDAAVAYSIKSPSAISRCCNGKQQTAGGYHWEYVNPLPQNEPPSWEF